MAHEWAPSCPNCGYSRQKRNADIIERHRKGIPPKALAQDFKLSAARILQILAKAR
jgi:uncharacterized protein (DUF433 family)